MLMEMGSLAPGFQYASAKMASDLNIFQQPSPNFGIRRGGVIPAFLSSGGPQRDTLLLDADGDGFACSWVPIR